MGVVDTLTQFAEETSVHGPAYIAQTSSSKTKRVTWLCVFIGSLIYAISQIIFLSECKFKGYIGYDQLFALLVSF